MKSNNCDKNVISKKKTAPGDLMTMTGDGNIKGQLSNDLWSHRTLKARSFVVSLS